MPKESYDTNVKRKVIEKQGFLIKRKIIQGAKKQPKDIRVAFFPGTEALEYEFAYKPLGIPQENITAIERHEPNFNYWRRNSSFSMTEKHIDALDFFRHYQGEPFDVISLDYDGIYNFNVMNTVDYVAGNQALSKKAIFAVNVFSKREQEVVQNHYADSIKGLVSATSQIPFKPSFDRLSILDQENRGFNRNDLDSLLSGEMNVSETRDLGITLSIMNGLTGGISNCIIPSMYKRSPHFKRRDQEVREKIKRQATSKDFEICTEEKMRAGLHAYYSEEFFHELIQYLDIKGHIPALASLLMSADKKAYHALGAHSFKYTSERGATMFTDIFYVDQRIEIVRKYDGLINGVFTPYCPQGLGAMEHAKRAAIFGNRKSYMKRYKRYQERTLRDIENLCPKGKSNDVRNFQPRMDLGSSRKPLIRSKNRLKELVKQGLSREEIEKRYRIGESIKGSLAAYIAHRTMETYNDGEAEQEQRPEKPRLKIQQKSIEKSNQISRLISKKDQRDLSAKGKISKNMHLRINYFFGDTNYLSDRRKQGIYNSILESNWFRDLGTRQISDLEVYAFFDDIMLNFVHQTKHIKPRKIRSLWDKILSTDKLYEVVQVCPSKQTEQIEREPEKLRIPEEVNQEIYEYIKMSIPDKEIMETFDLSRQQLGARKAWITMRK
jgi:hypothetical protein